ncbi:NADP-dependent oxidoreductase [Levilactobacillus zymae]|uniref:NADP-dependent oxidoreductase n=1 Tax=Levilactobacillus zymae TaxID=267363 RepID=UPI0028B2B015|nr:NADP-dependent oxidoreductase [Levilactobacillus zymae]MDT6980619.1 NADP-dependent oxidoreductase [Levilactobacillus zymae]
MQAAQLDKYDKNFQLKVRNIPKPVPQPNEVLVRVKYAAVNPLEALIGTGSVRVLQGYRFPLTMGNEFSGIVEAVGANVTAFKPNDAVYARMPLAKIGAFAEYLTIDQAELAGMPSQLDFAHAAAVPLAGLTAYQAFHDILKPRPGQRLMILGGSGSLGQLTIPMAKQLGLTVAVSGNQRGQAGALRLGADQYFDYRTENYWDRLAPVDYVLDTLGPKELPHELAVLKPGGTLLSLKTGPNREFAQRNGFAWWQTLAFSLVGRKVDQQARQHHVAYRFLFVKSSGAQLAEVTKLVTQAHLEPAIDPHVFTLDEANQALDLVTTGHPKGKVLIEF